MLSDVAEDWCFSDLDIFCGFFWKNRTFKHIKAEQKKSSFFQTSLWPPEILQTNHNVPPCQTPPPTPGHRPSLSTDPMDQTSESSFQPIERITSVLLKSWSWSPCWFSFGRELMDNHFGPAQHVPNGLKGSLGYLKVAWCGQRFRFFVLGCFHVSPSEKYIRPVFCTKRRLIWATHLWTSVLPCIDDGWMMFILIPLPLATEVDSGRPLCCQRLF